jgi:hypothetical protein
MDVEDGKVLYTQLGSLCVDLDVLQQQFEEAIYIVRSRIDGLYNQFFDMFPNCDECDEFPWEHKDWCPTLEDKEE